MSSGIRTTRGVSRKDRDMLAVLASLGYIRKNVLTSAVMAHPEADFEDRGPIFDLQQLHNVEVSNKYEFFLKSSTCWMCTWKTSCKKPTPQHMLHKGPTDEDLSQPRRARLNVKGERRKNKYTRLSTAHPPGRQKLPNKDDMMRKPP